MEEFPIWRECKRCTRFVSTEELPRCSDPFPPTGICPLPEERQRTVDHPFLNDPQLSHFYTPLFAEHPRLASIFYRWYRGETPNDRDFLYIRELSLHPDHPWIGKPRLPFHFLKDVLLETVIQTASDFAIYNLAVPAPDTKPGWGLVEFVIEVQPVQENIIGCLRAALIFAEPKIVQANRGLGSDWSRLVMDQARLFLWKLYGCQHLDLSKKTDAEFRQLFEQEWKKLLRYQDNFYGFRVLPKLSLTDMVRYQKAPHGDVKIRRAISVYLTHQATEYPYFAKIFADNFTEVAFEERIRESYRPLIDALCTEAMENLNIVGTNRSTGVSVPEEREQIRAHITSQLWERYEKSRKRYRFYWDKPQRVRLFGKAGFVGLQHEEIKEKLDQLLEQQGSPIRARDLSEVPFAHFIRERLRRWVTKTYPADKPTPSAISLDEGPEDGGATLGEKLSGLNSWNADETSLPLPQETFRGKDGVEYITIRPAALRHDMSEDQMRRLDELDVLTCKRVSDVCEKPYPLPADFRLYPLTPEFDQAARIAKARLATHSSQLQGQELPRSAAAKSLGVHQKTLEKWEKKGLVNPQKKGKIVVYDPVTYAQAEELVAKSPKVRRSSRS